MNFIDKRKIPILLRKFKYKNPQSFLYIASTIVGLIGGLAAVFLKIWFTGQKNWFILVTQNIITFGRYFCLQLGFFDSSLHKFFVKKTLRMV
jgi:hypothetical protein